TTWLLPEHMSRFTPIGAGAADLIPMVNRGSWVQVVAIGEGLAGAGSVLPPGNSGFLSSAELALSLAGAQPQPARMTAELEHYVTFAYKPFALTADEVATVTVSTETLDILALPA
ncbi:MAG TPA: hypothetical protein VI796_05920, partial [Candidatus Thermoplasmatota archaeon]|nr:hypothetical protein [Candidatus Thermoplasmatota archaeon]